MPVIPILVALGAGALGGGLLGFTAGGGAKGISNTIKFSVLGGVALLAAREFGLLKGVK